MHPLSKRAAAELLGTMWLVLGGCGSAIFAAKAFQPIGMTDPSPAQLGIGYLGVALAFGLTVVTMAYAVGHVSGGHFNPAVTIGLWAAKRFDNLMDVVVYVVAQVVGGLIGGAILFGLARSVMGSGTTGHMAANGYGEHSPGGYPLYAVFIAEALLTAFFLFVILGVITKGAPAGFAPLAIGLTLTVIHLISIPISNTSVNPARSTAVAFFNGNGAPGQLWVFWVAPIVGAVLAGFCFEKITGVDRSYVDVAGEPVPGDRSDDAAPAALETAGVEGTAVTNAPEA